MKLCDLGADLRCRNYEAELAATGKDGVFPETA